jgi:hypothetical protein
MLAPDLEVISESLGWDYGLVADCVWSLEQRGERADCNAILRMIHAVVLRECSTEADYEESVSCTLPTR